MNKTHSTSLTIHPTAIIHPKAELDADVTVGAYSIIAADVVIGSGCEVMNHVNIGGPTRIGKNNRIFHYASIGQDPQDKKYVRGEPSELEIGDGNTIREFVTLNRGSEFGGGKTRIGNKNWIMAYTHVAHDCTIGNEVILANLASVGGHVTIHDKAVIGGSTAIHQYCSIGEMALTGAQSMIVQDIAPYVIAVGNRAKLAGINRIGLERNGVAKEEIQNIQAAYKRFFRGKTSAEDSLAGLESQFSASPYVMNFVNFIRNSTRGICR